MSPHADRSDRAAADLVPAISPRLVRLFGRYCRGFIRRHFHSVRTLESHRLPGAFPDLSVTVFINHSSWWDPLFCLFLAHAHFPGRDAFGPIDAAALARYRMLARLGFFGVERGDARDVVSFLRTATAILQSPKRMLWLTPQGEFADARKRPAELQRGIAHLAARVAPAVFIPLAIEYSFWEERLPEVLLAWGTPIFTANHRDSCGVDDWSEAFARGLTDTQDALAAAAQRREPAEWSIALRGGRGTSRIYDGWRAFRAGIAGRSFRADHSDL